MSEKTLTPAAEVAEECSDAAPAQPAPAVDLSRLNGPQRKIAQTLESPLFVEAGAGSGKTFTLTQRVAWALCPGSGEGGAPFLDGLDQVLVITFTEAAAREIKERVRSTLRAAHMGQEALAVDDAWISTIHGMCSRILHRHALGLGLDPDFTITAGSEAASLHARAMDSVMREARADAAFDEVFSLYELGGRKQEGGYTGLMQVVNRLLEEASALPEGVDGLVPVGAGANTVATVMGDLTLRLEELGACKLTKSAAEKVGPALEAVRAFGALAPGERTAEAAERALDAVSLPRSSGPIADVLPAVKSALALARAEVAFARVAPCAAQVLELARRVQGRYDALKYERSCLDNNDLVRLALLAVRDHEEVRRDYAGRFKLVMVDEFQDTDQMQLQLIGMLAGEGARHLCTVGDAQQSIYRFRGADVGVFYGRGEGVDESGRVRLDVNYRSHADVLALVERVCTGGEGPASGTMRKFMPLAANPARADAYKARDLPRIDLEVVGGPGGSAYPTAAQSQAMADQVADAFARYRDHGESPSGMALLLGVTTHADLYIDAIRARGMECVVTGGSTFTRTDEVRVMRALLHTLANPADTQSGLFPLLASEVFGLDANDFCELGTRAQEKLDAPTKRTIDRGLLSLELYGRHAPSARLARAHEVLTRALDEVRHRPVADVCAEVVRDSGWLARLEAAGAPGRARAANVLAAVRYIRDLTQSMGLGAARAATEFDLWLAASKIPPASLAGAEDGAAGGTVQIMTIHASKGLEFPVCAVVECWGKRASAAELACGPAADGGRAFVLAPKDRPKTADIDPEELEPGADRSRALPLAAQYLAFRQDNEASEAQEKARLLYVALTRAREALIVGIMAEHGKGGLHSDLAAATLDALDIVPDASGEYTVNYGGSEPARVRCTYVEKDPSGEKPAAGEEAPGAGADAVPAAGLGPAADPEPEPFALFEPDPPAEAQRGSWRAREGVFSYSSVHALLEAEAGAARPLPTAAQRTAADAGAPSADDADRATNLGSAFHELAQAMVESGRAPSKDQVGAMARHWNLSARATARLQEALARWEGSSIRQEALSHGRVRAEVPFFQSVDSPYGEYLEGAIDLLATDEGSAEALVVDYKTGDAGLAPEEVRARHALQAEFYAGVLMREGYARVTCVFVCVEREDPADPAEPLVVRYAFGA